MHMNTNSYCVDTHVVIIEKGYNHLLILYLNVNCSNSACWRQTPALMLQFKPHTFIPSIVLGFHFEGNILFFPFVKEIHSLHFLDHFQNIWNDASHFQK